MRRIACAVLAVAAVVAGSWAAEAATIAEWNFEQGIGNWATLDPQAELTAAAGTGYAVEGSFSLHIAYPRPASAQELGERGFLVGAFGTELTEPLTDQVRCLDFYVRVKRLTVLAVSLDENDDSNYTRPVLLLPGAWRHLKLYLDEFTLSDDSQDENGKLDPEQIQRVAFLDAHGFLLTLSEQAKGEEFRFPKLPAGDNEIWLDAVKFTDEAGPQRTTIEDCSGETPAFVAVLGPQLQVSKTDKGPKGRPAWVLKYALGDRELGIMVWPVPKGLLADSAGLHMVLSATSPTGLLVQVKERGGAKYNYILQVEPGVDVDQQLAWPDFTVDEEAPDPNGKLDPADVVELTIIDGTSLLLGGAHENQLSIALIEPAK